MIVIGRVVRLRWLEVFVVAFEMFRFGVRSGLSVRRLDGIVRVRSGLVSAGIAVATVIGRGAVTSVRRVRDLLAADTPVLNRMRYRIINRPIDVNRMGHLDRMGYRDRSRYNQRNLLRKLHGHRS